MFSCAAKTTFTTFTGSEFVDDREVGLNDRDDDQLGDTFQRVENEALVSAIPARDQQLSLIIGIDEADQVAEYDAMFVTEAGAGQDHGCIARISQMDRHAGRNQYRLSWLKCLCMFDAGA